MAISRRRSPRSRACRPQCARRRRAGAPGSRRAAPRSRRRAISPRARSARWRNRETAFGPDHAPGTERRARMIRVVVFLIATVVLALGVVWLTDRPGQVTITWLGYRTATSVMVAIVAIGVVGALAVMLWSLVRALFRSPKLFAYAMRERQKRKGYDALS